MRAALGFIAVLLVIIAWLLHSTKRLIAEGIRNVSSRMFEIEVLLRKGLKNQE